MALGNISAQGRAASNGWPADTDHTTVAVWENEGEQVAERLGVSVDDLLAANPQITDPHHLNAGMEINIPQGTRDAAPAGSDVQDSSNGTARANGEMYAEAQMMAPLMKAKVNSAAATEKNSASSLDVQTYLSGDPRFADLNAALDAGEGTDAIAAANKVIAGLKSEKQPDMRLLNQARMGLAAGALMAGKLDDAKQALLAIPRKDLNETDKNQYDGLRDLLKETYRSSFGEAFQEDTATGAQAEDRGKAAADKARSLLDLIQKTEPGNTAEIDDTRLRLSNALLLGGHYSEAQKALSGINQKQLAPEQSEYLGAIQQEIHAQQIGALRAAFSREMAQGHYPQAVQDATARVNDVKKYFPEAKQQITEARLDQSTAQLMNGDIKSARSSLNHITRESLNASPGETQQRYTALNNQIDQAEKNKAEQTDVQRRLENIKRQVAYGDEAMKNDAVMQAQRLLVDLQTKHPENSNLIDSMKMTLADVMLAAGDAKNAGALAKEVAGATDDSDMKDQAQLFQAQALLQEKPPQIELAAKTLHSSMQNASTAEVRDSAKGLLISLESDYVDTIGRKANGEVKGLNDFKRHKWGNDKYDVEFRDAPEEKEAFKTLGEIAKGANLASSVMKANGLTVEDLQTMDEQKLAGLRGVTSEADAKLLRKTLSQPDMRVIGRNDFQKKQFSWDQNTLYVSTSIYDDPKDKAAKWIGEQVRGARSQERDWEKSDSKVLRAYGKFAGGILDGVSAVDETLKNGIKASYDYYQRKGGVLGKLGQAATFLVDQPVSAITMPATVLDYKASDEERAGALQGTLLMAATAGLLKAGGPALREAFGTVGEGIAKSAPGRYVAESWLGDAAKRFEASRFATGVDKLTAKVADTLGTINRFGSPKSYAKGIDDMLDNLVGNKTAGDLQASITPQEVKPIERQLIKREYDKLVDVKKDQLTKEKLDEPGREGRRLSKEEAKDIATEAKKMVKREYGQSLREKLPESMRKGFSEEEVRDVALAKRFYRQGYHGKIEPKPAHITQAQFAEELESSKGKQLGSIGEGQKAWEAPDGKSLVFESDGEMWQHRVSKIVRDGGRTVEIGVASGEDIRRFYLNVKPDKAAELANYLTEKLNAQEMNWQFKMPKEIENFDRPDSGVLYVDKQNYAAAKKIVLEYAKRNPEAFGKEIPALTKQIAPGVGVAEEPIQKGLPKSTTRHSFGTSRSAIMSEAVLDAPVEATKKEITKLVRERMKKYGLDPDHPWLNKATKKDDL